MQVLVTSSKQVACLATSSRLRLGAEDVRVRVRMARATKKGVGQGGRERGLMARARRGAQHRDMKAAKAAQVVSGRCLEHWSSTTMAVVFAPCFNGGKIPSPGAIGVHALWSPLPLVATVIALLPQRRDTSALLVPCPSPPFPQCPTPPPGSASCPRARWRCCRCAAGAATWCGAPRPTRHGP